MPRKKPQGKYYFYKKNTRFRQLVDALGGENRTHNFEICTELMPGWKHPRTPAHYYRGYNLVPDNIMVVAEAVLTKEN